MRNKSAALRTVAVVAAAVLLALASSSDAVSADKKCRGQGLPGTWFVSVPGGLTGFYTYNVDGTMTGTVSTIHGGPPWPSGFPSLHGSDHGVWRRVRGGFEAWIYRMSFDPDTGSAQGFIRIRSLFKFDKGRQSTSGTFLVDQWACPDTLCPDPNSTPPDVEGISPPPPFNGYTQTRVRMP